MIDHIEIITEGFDLKDKTVRLLKPKGYERYEGRECLIVAKYAHDAFYYVKLNSGKIFVVEMGDFLIQK